MKIRKCFRILAKHLACLYYVLVIMVSMKTYVLQLYNAIFFYEQKLNKDKMIMNHALKILMLIKLKSQARCAQ